MTKIKNTKKGMAKKTLSISLAVAMLATSNVPVWAAEFTDGTDAAFTSEVEAPVEVVDEAPVVENEAPITATYAEGDYTADVTFDKSSVTWNNETIIAKVNMKKADGTAVNNFHAAWKLGADETSAIGEEEEEGNQIEYTTKEADFGKNLYLYLWIEENGVTLWDKTVKAAHVDPVDVGADQYFFSWFMEDGTGAFSNKGTDDVWERTYDGKTLPKTATLVDANGDRTSEFNVNYPDDLKNVGEFTLKATPKDAKYIGVVEEKFRITPKTISVREYRFLDANLKDDKKSFAWTGNLVKFDKADVTLKDTDTNDDISALVTSVTARSGNTSVGKYDVVVHLNNNETVKNYKVVSSDEKGIDIGSANKYEITARDLADCTFTVGSIEYKAGLTGNDVKSAITSVVAKDGTKLNVNEVKNRIQVEFPEGGLGSASTTPYTVTIKPTTITKCLTGKTTASVRVVDRSLANADYNENCAELNAEEYTGSQITKDIEKLTDKKTGLKLKDGNSELVYGTHYTISFGSNVNVKDGGQIIINGIGAYEGSTKVIPFTINPAKVTNKDLSASEYILHDSEKVKPAEYAKEFNLVVKGHNADKKEFTLVEGTDYTVDYSFNTKNDIDHKVEADITLAKDGNFTATETLTKEVILVEPVIRDENIVLKKDTYEYTAAPIVPEFDVVINGETLVKDEDYVILNTQDVTEVGEAKVVITGKGKYSDKVKAEAKFTVVATSAENVKVTLDKDKVTYNGKVQKPNVEAAVLGQNASVLNQFDISYGKNINAGKGTVILTPKKNNKNFTGTKTVEFTIEPAELEGTLTLYNEKNLVVNKDNSDAVNYNGAAHTYAKETFTDSVSTPVTANDYEIVYADNVYGRICDLDNNRYGAVLVVAKGNYKNNTYTSKVNTQNNGLVVNGIYTDAEGNKIENVVAVKWFKINPAEIHKNNISVSNGQYREGYNVKPEVVVTVGGKTLLEGKDYELDFKVNGVEQKRTEVTNSKSLKVTIVPINGYKKAGTEDFTFSWGIDKFDFANAEVVVTGTDAAPIVKVLNDGILVDPENYDLTTADGKATIKAKEDSKNYTGSQTVEIKHALEQPEKPMITDVKVVGNKATVVLSGESEGAVGYDYVISKDKDCITNKNYAVVNRNKLTTDTTFQYVDQGVYYAYCHAWTRDENGKKVFSEWSNGYPFSVTAITPSKPTITSVKVKGSTVTVTYTKSSNATGYDVVLGSKVATINDEKRPVEYGTLVKKNIKGNTVTATFKNVKKGTYYAGLHAFNRTSEDGKKVFSPWSDAKKVTVR